MLRASRGDAAVLLATFALTIFRDLTEAIVVGFALGSVLFIHRMSLTTAVASETPFVLEDQADETGARPAYESGANNAGVVIYRISGAFFFGAAASIGAVLDRIGDTHRALIIDFSAVPFVDSTAARTIEGLARNAAKKSVRIFLTGTSPELRRELARLGVSPKLARYKSTIERAVREIHAGAGAGD